MSVLITYAPASAGRANALAERLEAQGVKVSSAPAPAALSPSARGKLAEAVRGAKAVLVLWSRGAPLALRAIATLAKRAGKLVMARLDATRPPFGARRAIDLSRTDTPRALRELHNALSGGAKMTSQVSAVGRTSRIEAIGMTLLMALVVGVAAYVADASFAARVDAVAHDTQARVVSLIGLKS